VCPKRTPSVPKLKEKVQKKKKLKGISPLVFSFDPQFWIFTPNMHPQHTTLLMKDLEPDT
jgi:hypothetical protein